MTYDKDQQPESNFVKFVWEMSEAAHRLEELEADPERVMSEAGLSEEEKEVIRCGDESQIMAMIGQAEHAGLFLTIRHIKVRFRRRRPPTPSPT